MRHYTSKLSELPAPFHFEADAPQPSSPKGRANTTPPFQTRGKKSLQRETTMAEQRKDRKLRRREFLQTVAAGGAVMPALGLGTVGLEFHPAAATAQTSDSSSSEGSKPSSVQDVISIENQTLRTSFDAHSGALVGLESKLTGWRIQNRRELGRSFVMVVPLPGRRDNPVLGEKNPLVRIEKSADGKSLSFVWKDLESQYGGRLDITLKSTVTLDEQGLSFESEIANYSPYVVETVSYPILGDLAVPAGEKSLTREDLNY